MESSEAGNAHIDDWLGPHSTGSAPRVWPLFGVGAGLGCGLAAALGGWAAGSWGAAVAVALAGAGATAVLTIQRRIVLRAAGARPLRPGEAPRLVNLATGLAADARMPVPALMIATRPEPNALVWDGRRPVVAVTSGMVGGFARTELEAVLAHSLLRLQASSTRALAPAVMLSRLGFGRAPMVAIGDDVRAAALTRYPPALASAIAKCIPERSRVAPAYFVAEGPSHASVKERLAALGDL